MCIIPTFFCPVQTFSVTLMSKSKKTLEMSFDPTPLFKTSVDARVEDLVSNVDYLKWYNNFI